MAAFGCGPNQVKTRTWHHVQRQCDTGAVGRRGGRQGGWLVGECCSLFGWGRTVGLGHSQNKVAKSLVLLVQAPPMLSMVGRAALIDASRIDRLTVAVIVELHRLQSG